MRQSGKKKQRASSNGSPATMSAAELTVVPPLPFHDRKRLHSKLQAASASGSHGQHQLQLQKQQHQHQLPFFLLVLLLLLLRSAYASHSAGALRSAPPPMLLPLYGGIENIYVHAAALYKHEYEYEYEPLRDDASSTTPNGQERTMKAGRRRPAGTSQHRSSGL